MLQRYRLRLGDGTVLQVDKDGLQAWVQDDPRAVVQVAGTQQWRSLREFLAEEESAERLRRALVPPEPRRAAAEAPVEPAPRVPPEPAPSILPEPAPSILPEPAPSILPEPERSLPAFEPAIGAPPVQALAEEPSSPAAPWQLPPEPPGVEAPAIRLKPLEEGPSADDEVEIVDEAQDPYALSRPRAYASLEEGGRLVRHDRLEGPLLYALTALGTVLSRLLDPLAPLVSRWPSGTRARSAGRPESRRAPEPPLEPHPSVVRPIVRSPAPPLRPLAEDPSPAVPRAGWDDLPAIPLKPLEDEGRTASAAEGVSAKASAWLGRVAAALAASSAWLAGLPARLGALRPTGTRPDSAAPAPEAAARTPAPLAPRAPAPPRARTPVEPPTPVAELPSIRLAATSEAPEEGDVYDGDEETGPSVLPVVWAWTKRLVLVGGLAAAGVYAALTWEAWFPRAGELGQTLFTEIDRQTHSAQREREHEQAVANATDMCPQLAPETVRLVLATSPDRVLEPPEVFRVATDAAERGIGSLPPDEASELRSLQHALVVGLRPPQQARLAEYERARVTRGVFPFENPYALDLVARGARALPEASRARLQHLLGKAVSAGLGPPAPSPASVP